MTNKNDMLLHRFIMNAQKGKLIDHKNRNTLDTRKSNLRECDRSQNTINSPLYSNNKTGYRGIVWVEREGKWGAWVKQYGKFINLGYYSEMEDAIKARKRGEEKYYGEFVPQDDLSQDKLTQ